MPVPASSRVVLYGATGYTGELTAREMVRRGMRPVLAGRGRKRLEKLADELGGLEVALADVTEPQRRGARRRGRRAGHDRRAVRALGEPALMAALTKRAALHRLDRREHVRSARIRERGPRAESEGVALLTAMGYDWVPGNLAGALALREAGATRGACDPATSTPARQPRHRRSQRRDTRDRRRHDARPGVRVRRRADRSRAHGATRRRASRRTQGREESAMSVGPPSTSRCRGWPTSSSRSMSTSAVRVRRHARRR